MVDHHEPLITIPGIPKIIQPPVSIESGRFLQFYPINLTNDGQEADFEKIRRFEVDSSNASSMFY